jgi:hypothetical protein
VAQKEREVPDINLLHKPIDAAAKSFGEWAKAGIRSTVIVIPERGYSGDIIVITNGEQKVCETAEELLSAVCRALKEYNPEVSIGLYGGLASLGLLSPTPE